MWLNYMIVVIYLKFTSNHNMYLNTLRPIRL